MFVEIYIPQNFLLFYYILTSMNRTCIYRTLPHYAVSFVHRVINVKLLWIFSDNVWIQSLARWQLLSCKSTQTRGSSTLHTVLPILPVSIDHCWAKIHTLLNYFNPCNLSVTSQCSAETVKRVTMPLSYQTIKILMEFEWGRLKRGTCQVG